KEENQGFDAFLPLIDSGISISIWSKEMFFSIILYTCKNFNEHDAVAFIKDYFQAASIQTLSF
ncbi:MAG: S-adenosylmethionine decarboxylase, partial [Gammaproteobacteria bacterium]|nr:S-adenosylmethionine decarboxylase [Gammaproteobacteria bacterium]